MGWTQRTDYSAPSPVLPPDTLPQVALPQVRQPQVEPPQVEQPWPMPPAEDAWPPAVEPPALRPAASVATPAKKLPSASPSPSPSPPPPYGWVEPWAAHVQAEAPAEAQPPPLSLPSIDWAGYAAKLGPAKLLALVGGIALLLGMAYFLSLAMSRGWITNEMRVVLGLVIGFGLLPVGALLFDRERPTLGHVVVAVGLATIDLALFLSSQTLFTPAWVALIGATIAALGAGVIAVRWNSQLVAGMGIGAVLAAPPIVSAPADMVTVFFLGAVLAGVAYVAFRRNWEWLPWLSFVLTAPQLFAWLAPGDVAPVLVMVVLGAYWILFAVSALLPVVLGAKRDLARQISLLASITAFVTVAAWLGLADPWLRGAFIGALAAGNLATGLGLVLRRGLKDDLAQSALALGIALYVVAIALLLGGPAVPIAWTLAMAASGWVWGRYHLLRAGLVALALAALVAIHLLTLEYPIAAWLGWSVAPRPEQLLPYANAEGVALAVYLIGLAVVARLVRYRLVRQAIVAFAGLMVAATLPAEALLVSSRWATAPLLALGWTALAVLMLAADQRWHARWRFDSLRQPLPIAGALLGVVAVGYVAFLYLAVAGSMGFGVRPGQTLPYFDNEGIALAIYLIGLAAVFVLSRDALLRQWIAAGATVLVAVTLPIESGDQTAIVQAPLLALGWTVLAVLTLAADQRWHARWRFDSLPQPLPIAGGLLGVAALGYVASLYLAIPWDTAFGLRPGQTLPYLDNEGIALGIYLIGLAAVFVLSRDTLLRQWIGAGAALLIAATLPIESFDQTAFVQTPLLALGWTVLAFAALAGDGRWHTRWRIDPWRQPLPIAGALLGFVALAQLSSGYRLLNFAAPLQPGGVPFTDESSLITLTVVGAIVLLAISRRDSTERFGVACLSLLVVAVLLRQQLPLEWAVVGWCVIAGGMLVATPRDDPRALMGYLVAALWLGAGAIATVAAIAPPTRLAVHPISAELGMGPPNAATIAIVAMALGMAVATWREGRMVGTRWLGIGVLVAVVYGLSVGLVDSFAVRVPNPAALEEIGLQAQVALTILWALIGLGLLGYGLLRDSLAGRAGGLALLTLATAKAFVYDLSNLDIAYRVLSLIGLGVLLLAGAFAYQRLRSRSGPGGAAGAAGAAAALRPSRG